MDILPIELLHEIASYDEASYKALLAIPLFARSLTPRIIVDYQYSFGYSVSADSDINGDYVFWMLNWKLHRRDGPAIEYKNGDKEWYINGKRHRKDGPAIECADGRKEWWINGRMIERPLLS